MKEGRDCGVEGPKQPRIIWGPGGRRTFGDSIWASPGMRVIAHKWQKRGGHLCEESA